MTILADDLVSDEFWALVAPLLPAPPRPPYRGRHRTVSDRACMAAIIFMARPTSLTPAMVKALRLLNARASRAI